MEAPFAVQPTIIRERCIFKFEDNKKNNNNNNKLYAKIQLVSSPFTTEVCVAVVKVKLNDAIKYAIIQQHSLREIGLIVSKYPRSQTYTRQSSTVITINFGAFFILPEGIHRVDQLPRACRAPLRAASAPRGTRRFFLPQGWVDQPLVAAEVKTTFTT